MGEGAEMSSKDGSAPTFLNAAPRFVVNDLDQALVFYKKLGFQTAYHSLK